MRDHKLDNLKFIMLFLVVLGHVLEMGNIQSGVFGILYTSIYMFHMPVMVIVSGYFSRKIADKGEQGILTRYIKLALPSLILQFIFGVLSYMFTGAVQAYWILWYTVALVIWDYLIEYTKFRYWPVLMLVMVFLFGNMGMIINTFFGRIVYFMPFYLVGYYMDLSALDRLKPAFRKKIIIGATMLAAAGIYVFSQSGLDYRLFYFSRGYSDLGLNMASGTFYRLLAYVISMSLSFIFLLITSRRSFAYVKSTNTMTTYLLHGLIIKTIGWITNTNLNSLIIGLMLTVAIVAVTSHKRLFSDMFKGILEWGTDHKQAIHNFRSVSLLLIFAVYGYLASPLILESKEMFLQNRYSSALSVDALSTMDEEENTVESDTEDIDRINEVVNVEIKPFTGFNWENSPASVVLKPLTDIGSVVYDHENRTPRVEQGEVYNLSLDGQYLSYSKDAFEITDELMTLKLDFVELNDQIGIEFFNGKYLSVFEGQPVLGPEPTPLIYEVRDKQVSFAYNGKYLSIDGGELVFEAEQKFWDVELEIVDDSPLTYFSQIDDRWRYDDFANSNISIRGCGLASMAMILNYELDDTIDVDDMIALDRKYKLGRNEPPRIDVDRFAKIIDEDYDVFVKKIELDEIEAELKSGRLIYYHTSNNPSIGYKNFGHIFVIYGMTKDGKFKFLDPYPGDIAQIPADDSLQYHGQLFSYKTLSGIRKSAKFTGYITLDAMSKASKTTVYSIWR